MNDDDGDNSESATAHSHKTNAGSGIAATAATAAPPLPPLRTSSSNIMMSSSPASSAAVAMTAITARRKTTNLPPVPSNTIMRMPTASIASSHHATASAQPSPAHCLLPSHPLPPASPMQWRHAPHDLTEAALDDEQQHAPVATTTAGSALQL